MNAWKVGGSALVSGLAFLALTAHALGMGQGEPVPKVGLREPPPLPAPVAAAEALGRIRHLLDGVGELMHHHLGEDAGHQQHQTGREEEVREELLAELHQPVARRAEEKVAGTLAALAAHLMHRDVALLGQYAVQRTEDVIILLGLGRLFQHGRLHHIPGQIVRV